MVHISKSTTVTLFLVSHSPHPKLFYSILLTFVLEWFIDFQLNDKRALLNNIPILFFVSSLLICHLKMYLVTLVQIVVLEILDVTSN